MSDLGDDDREFDDARDAFDEDAPVGDVAAAFVPHADQRDAEVYDGSDGDGVDDDDDGLGSDDESDGEDLMNDMERCARTKRGEATRARTWSRQEIGVFSKVLSCPDV